MGETGSGVTLYRHFDAGKPYLAIMRNGKEHVGFIEEVDEDGWMTVTVLVPMTLTLWDPGPDSPGLEISVDQESQAKEKFSGKQVYVQEPCCVRHKWQKFRMWAADISVLEDFYRKAVDILPDGSTDEVALVVDFPSLEEYHRIGGGFCTNPAGGKALRLVE